MSWGLPSVVNYQEKEETNDLSDRHDDAITIINRKNLSSFHMDLFSGLTYTVGVYFLCWLEL